jgi:hypothetical protein
VIEAPLVDHSKTREVLQRRYFWVLATLLFLFCLRVLGQILVAFFHVPFLPPMEEWFSGLLPYPGLLTTQILIIALYGQICLDYRTGSLNPDNCRLVSARSPTRLTKPGFRGRH